MINSSYITFQKISFGFNGKEILHDFNLEIMKDKHTVLEGESGSGKSTILKSLLGFLTPNKGSIIVDGQQLHPQKVRQKTAWLPQDLNLGDGSVREVMKRPFSFKVNQSKKDLDFAGSLESLGVPADHLEKKFRDLSTGQRQRVGVAICYLLDKPLLLLDEPTAALDRASKQKVADLLLDQKRTIISTSHDPFWVDLADNVIAL
ncbi:MAG TPA: ABC transporter ATP-binding protein [Balneolaceae bacterium]|nr:ABC transporter ATP-binding protein [Balneolaceae bacterium]